MFDDMEFDQDMLIRIGLSICGAIIALIVMARVPGVGAIFKIGGAVLSAVICYFIVLAAQNN